MIYLSCVLMIAVGWAGIAFSDERIRARGKHGVFGLNADTWDFAGTVTALVGAACFVALVIKEIL